MNKKILLLSLLSLSLFAGCASNNGENQNSEENISSNGGTSEVNSQNGSSSSEGWDYTITEGTDGILYELNEAGDGYVVTEYLSIETDIQIPELYDGEGGLLPVREIGPAAFRYTTMDSLILPRSLRIIREEAFLNIESGSELTKLELPEGLEVIEDSAFEWCPTIEEVNIPSTVKSIGREVFHLCGNLKKLKVAEDNPYYCAVNNVLFDKEQKTLLCYPEGLKLVAYDMPNTVETIAKSAFYGNDSLQRMTLSSALKTVEEHGLAALDGVSSFNFNRTKIETLGDKALAENDSLTSITLPTTITSFGKSVFASDSSLASFNYADGKMSEVPEGFFSACSRLGTVTLPSTVTKIGKSAFQGCNTLTTVNGIQNVEEIGANAFNACAKLANFTLPTKLKKIEEGAFGYCWTLENLSFGSDLESIGNRAFTACQAMTSVDLSNTKVTSIGDVAFMNSNIASIKFPTTLKKIGEQCFDQCSKLEVVDFNSGLEEIGESALADCNALRKVFIPSSVTKIAPSAFLNKFRKDGDPDLCILFESKDQEALFANLNISEAKTHLEFGVSHEEFLNHEHQA